MPELLGRRESRFSRVLWSKLKIVTKSRIWDTIDDWYVNNLAKDQVSAVFHSRVICRSALPKYYRALYGGAMFVPFRGTQTWRLLNNINICHWVLLLKWNIIALETWQIEKTAFIIQLHFAVYKYRLRRVQISRGIWYLYSRGPVRLVSCVDQSISWISHPNSVPLRILLSRIPCKN